MKTRPLAVKFVSWEVPPLENLKDYPEYILRQRLNNGGKLTREDKDWLAEHLYHNCFFSTSLPLRGYRFDFSDTVKRYIVNQYGQWNEYYAPDKTSLRNTLRGKINKIIEVK